MKLFGQGGVIDFSVDQETLTTLEYDHLYRTGNLEAVLEDVITKYPDDPDYPVILEDWREQRREDDARPWYQKIFS